MVRRPGKGYRYGRWRGGPDPLAPPYDLGSAVDEIGDSVLGGSGVREALRELLRRGMDGRRGLDELRRSVRERLRQARNAGRMDGTLQEVRELLDRAVEAERRELFPDPDDMARLAEAELDALPEDTAGAVRALKEYDWRSAEARQAYEQIQDLLRREVLDSSFASMKQALENASEGDVQAVKDMVADLSQLIDAHNRGEDTDEQFREFMEKHGQFFPDDPQSVEDLIDQLARRAAAQERMMAGLSPEQRAELADLMAQTMQDMGLASEMAHLQDALRQARPDLPWGQRGQVPDGEQSLGMGDATSAVAELADLEALSNQLSQGYAGASLADVDEELLERALGRPAVDDLAALRRMERELERQGYLNRSDGKLELSPKAVRRLGATALRRVFAQLDATGRGEHDVADAGAAGELTGSSREWRFGDEQPLDVVRTVKNAVLRTAHEPRAERDRHVRIAVEDFEVVETERRTGAAVALLVDLSYSMALRGTWGAAKSTAMALHSLVTTRFPQDAIQIIGFSSTAQVLRPETLAELSVDTLQGTNLQHGLMLARRFLARHRDAEPVVLVVTDGEPTAHLEDDGTPFFCWPPMPETIARTVAEVERVARSGATMNVFALDPEPGLVHFVHDITQRAGGRVFTPDSERLGEYVVADYLRTRRGRRAR
ncbi:VWA domain-containing protein [Geodermatophilus obscurus]|uniref:von Willebrand factor type A n=1 Tax=Geodermatophilus obscurus (strain ATCC 25078 / DSM 43160 / JCM 3152 / CCUG 61914 / KCC A-0152 / KCTC 9177 / NBRC 13315 / NRRL B-3577 / G-20) TaxID=526225 RepID=D2S952_GEOOG|nr:VWA domain-containing protein [Geodermatophilus obscurus]ADB73695.1 von Willebrand factor type A [Geodermatophilus obscurus DSM 43160]